MKTNLTVSIKIENYNNLDEYCHTNKEKKSKIVDQLIYEFLNKTKND